MVARALVCSLSLCLACAAAAERLPRPPAGFSWVEIDELGAAFLRPDGWHFTNNKAKLQSSFVVSREKPGIGRTVETSLIVYSIRNMGKTDREPPSQQVARFARDMKTEAGVEVLAVQRVARPPFRGFAVRYREVRPAAPPLMNHRLYLANDETDTLLFVTFQSPEGGWQEAWKTGETLVTVFVTGREE